MPSTVPHSRTRSRRFNRSISAPRKGENTKESLFQVSIYKVVCIRYEARYSSNGSTDGKFRHKKLEVFLIRIWEVNKPDYISIYNLSAANI